MTWTITYYSEAVRDWIDSLPVGIRAMFTRITERMMISGPSLGMPYTRALGDDLFEIRAKGREVIARVFYCTIVGNTIIMLHGFVKETQKTPPRELETARRRLQELRNEDA
jgi:phage-related protein